MRSSSTVKDIDVTLLLLNMRNWNAILLYISAVLLRNIFAIKNIVHGQML